MKYFIKIALLLLFFTSSFQNLVQAKEVVAVLNDNLRTIDTTYVVYPAASNLIAQDIVNKINLNDRIKAIPVTDSIDNLKQDQIFNKGERFIKEYKYLYTINYKILREMTKSLGATYILLVTSSLDIQSSFLQETIWNKLNVPGEDSVNSQYRMLSRITLIDPFNEFVIFEKTYKKYIPSEQFDLANIAYSPSCSQMPRIKKYTKGLADKVVPRVESKIIPEYIPVKKTFMESLHSKLLKKDSTTPDDKNIKIIPDENLQLYNFTHPEENL